jgi:transcriptional regulator with XRE-family HTH domain
MTRQGGIGDRGLGLELRRLRHQAGLSLEYVAGGVGWSMSRLSRFERGMRPETTPEEIAGLLGVMRVTGVDKTRALRMASGQPGQVYAEDHDADISDQARLYTTFESTASRIINVEPLLVPGLLQTSDYCRALLTALLVEDSKIYGRMARRLGRQKLLEGNVGPELVFIITELGMRQPIASRLLMAQQVRRVVRESERSRVSVRVIPLSVPAHPALRGGFVVLEFDDEPSIVHIEGRMSGLFPQTPEEIESYTLAADRLMALALSEQDSRELLLTIAEDLERAR